jgi:hypothetical protein
MRLPFLVSTGAEHGEVGLGLGVGRENDWALDGDEGSLGKL